MRFEPNPTAPGGKRRRPSSDHGQDDLDHGHDDDPPWATPRGEHRRGTAAERPPARRWVPARSTPPSSTHVRCDRPASPSPTRWAMTMAVRPPAARRGPARCASPSAGRGSTSASSSTSTQGRARTPPRARSWRSPDDSDEPRSWTGGGRARRAAGRRGSSRADQPHRLVDLGLRGVGPGEGEVGPEGVVEQERLLRARRRAGAAATRWSRRRCRRRRAAPGRRWGRSERVTSLAMVDFPAPRRPDEGEGLAGGDVQVDAPQHLGPVGRVPERHRLEPDLAFDRRQPSSRRAPRHRRRRRQQAPGACRWRPGPAGRWWTAARSLLDRGEERRQVQREAR